MFLADHQRVAVRQARALLEKRGGAILADGVGMGKSLVALAIASHFADEGFEIEIVVPATLLPQWQALCDEREIEATFITHHALRLDSSVVDPTRKRLIIVDEAHAFRNPATQRYDALARRSIAARLLLVTATPLCNRVDDIRALIGLIARDDLLADVGVPSIDVAFERRDLPAIQWLCRELMIRRERSVLPKGLRFGTLDRRVIRFPLFEGDGQISSRIDRLAFPLVGDGSTVSLLRSLLWRRLESSEEAFLETIHRQQRFYSRAMESAIHGRRLTKRDYLSAFAAHEDRELFQGVLFWDLWAPAAVAGHDGRAIEQEMSLLRKLEVLVRASPRAKLATLIDLCVSEKEPLIVFTGARATARAIHAAMPPAKRAVLLTGDDRASSTALNEFRRGAANVLVTTDVAAEGLNLQRAGVIVHYDIPWNPVRLDQRNGRAYRIGQKRPTVRAIYFLPAGNRTGVISIVAAKNRTRRRFLDGVALLPLPSCSQIRPRLTTSGGAALLAKSHRIDLDAKLARRHRAGLERLLAQIAAEYGDAKRLEDLRTMIDADLAISCMK